jgi:titin
MIQEDGVLIDNVAGNTIGGTTAAARDVISGNAYYGIQIMGSAATGNFVEGDYIGTNASGSAGIGNLSAGAFVTDGAASNVIGGTTAAAMNVISWNEMGVSVGGTGNVVEGNYVGTDATGLDALGNATDGIGAGGSSMVSDNIVCANGENGIGVSGGVTVVGNWVGVNVTGDTVVKNDESGVYVIGEDNVIGGTTVAARNVISGNQNANVLIDAGGSYNQVLGNYIGTNASDWMVLSNDIDIMIQGSASHNTIGGATAAAANVIGNAGVGVEITGGPESGGEPIHNTVEGNYIGTNAGTTNFANGDGVEIATVGTSAAPDYNLIGGTAAGTGNTIKFNGKAVDVLAGVGEAILGNSIYSNGTEIDLESILANQGQVAPVLKSVNRTANSVQVSGTLQSTPNTKFEIQIFSSPGLDASGNPEGETLLGTVTVTTNGNGTAAFNTTFDVSIPKMQFITGTATSLDSDGNPENTSEFSKAIVSN